MTEPVDAAREAILRWFRAALELVEPRAAVANALSFDGHIMRVQGKCVPVNDDARLVVIAIGKAASGMAHGAREVLGGRIDRGIVLTKYGHAGGDVEGFETFEASHPTPDHAGLRATTAILDAVSGLSASDVVLALISGGGSALLELPRGGVPLADMQDVTQRLMHAGAGIHDLNTVRKALSQVKGGGLRRAIGPARCVTLLLSDVLGNDPSVIASGPTVPSHSTPEYAQAVIARFELNDAVPKSVRTALDHAPDDGVMPDTSRDVVGVIADNRAFVSEIVRLAREEGARVDHIDEPFDGDARVLAADVVRRALVAPTDVDVIVRGGEATVTVRGNGRGGRNTEMALAAALAIESRGDWIIASLASDGDDGNSGAAGAIADGGTAERARAAGIDPIDALDRNDSANVFAAAGGLVQTGPTGTNVNDVYLAMRVRREPAEGA